MNDHNGHSTDTGTPEPASTNEVIPGLNALANRATKQFAEIATTQAQTQAAIKQLTKQGPVLSGLRLVIYMLVQSLT